MRWEDEWERNGKIHGWSKNKHDNLEEEDYETFEYLELLEATKCIMDSMLGMAEGIYTIAEIEGLNVSQMEWSVPGLELQINETIPEQDLYYITLHISPLRRSKSSHCPDIRYAYRIEDEYIERELIVSPEAPPIVDDGRGVLDELVCALKILSTK